jgi:hypothetical protein
MDQIVRTKRLTNYSLYKSCFYATWVFLGHHLWHLMWEIIKKTINCSSWIGFWHPLSLLMANNQNTSGIGCVTDLSMTVTQLLHQSINNQELAFIMVFSGIYVKLVFLLSTSILANKSFAELQHHSIRRRMFIFMILLMVPINFISWRDYFNDQEFSNQLGIHDILRILDVHCL